MAKRKNRPEKIIHETPDKIVLSQDAAKRMEQLATMSDLYVTPPQLKAEVHEWSGFDLNKDGRPVGKMKHWIAEISVEPYGDWGEYDGSKIAKAMKKAAERELTRQSRQYANKRTRGKNEHKKDNG